MNREEIKLINPIKFVRSPAKHGSSKNDYVFTIPRTLLKFGYIFPNKTYTIYLQEMKKKEYIEIEEFENSGKLLKTIFESITGKYAFWNGNMTKTFIKWKELIVKEYQELTKKKAFKKEIITSEFKKYLEEKVNEGFD